MWSANFLPGSSKRETMEAYSGVVLGRHLHRHCSQNPKTLQADRKPPKPGVDVEFSARMINRYYYVMS